jgi:hypothetical protein
MSETEYKKKEVSLETNFTLGKVNLKLLLFSKTTQKVYLDVEQEFILITIGSGPGAEDSACVDLEGEWSESSKVGTVLRISSDGMGWMRSSPVMWMRSSRVVRASDRQCRSRNCPWFDPSILRHS